MSTLKQTLDKMPYKEFKEKVKENVMSSDEYKCYLRDGIGGLKDDKKLKLKKLIIENLDPKCSPDDISDSDIRSFVIACEFRATFCK
jgi:hypothetical protein